MNVPVVYKAQDEVILMRATSISRAIRRGGPWNSRLLWALKWPPAKIAQVLSARLLTNCLQTKPFRILKRFRQRLVYMLAKNKIEVYQYAPMGKITSKSVYKFIYLLQNSITLTLFKPLKTVCINCRVHRAPKMIGFLVISRVKFYFQNADQNTLRLGSLSNIQHNSGYQTQDPSLLYKW